MVFAPGVTVETGAVIRAFSHLEGAVVRAGAIVGPYARLRPGADIGEDAHIGNFVEVKKVTVGKGAKANHLSYLGDGTVGAGANIGAGTIFCNYDGFDKYETHVGEGAFIGSNTALVAPVTIGAGAYTGSGSVITQDVAADALALVERGRRWRSPAGPRASAPRKLRRRRPASERADDAEARRRRGRRGPGRARHDRRPGHRLDRGLVRQGAGRAAAGASRCVATSEATADLAPSLGLKLAEPGRDRARSTSPSTAPTRSARACR